jgi:hypothetical protein
LVRSQAFERKRVGLAAMAAAVVGALAVFAASAPGEVLSPAITLGPTTVLNGTATVAGHVGAPSTGAQLAINGTPVAIDALGNFAAVLNLGGQSNLTFRLANSGGEVTSLNLPLNSNIVGPGGVISPGVLTALEQAAVSIVKPLDGFKITDELPLKVEGRVGDGSTLAGLTVNGKDVLGLVGEDRGFSITVPGTTREITVTSTDRQGVTSTTTYPVVQSASATSVAAAAAQGIRIAKIRYITKNVRRTKRMRMVVTVRDRRGLLIRNATISVRSRYARRIFRNPKAKKSNRVGQAAFLMRARNKAFGKRLVMITLAKTPKAKVSKSSSVRIPRLAKRRAARR